MNRLALIIAIGLLSSPVLAADPPKAADKPAPTCGKPDECQKQADGVFAQLKNALTLGGLQALIPAAPKCTAPQDCQRQIDVLTTETNLAGQLVTVGKQLNIYKQLLAEANDRLVSNAAK